MFNQRKRFPWGWAAVIVILAALGTVLLIDAFTTEKEAPKDQYDSTSDSVEYQAHDGDYNEQDEDDEAAVTSGALKKNKAYYLVKNDDHIIKVYYYDENGNCKELQETGIVYDVLSETDQRRFNVGLKVSDRESLNKLLMDYES